MDDKLKNGDSFRMHDALRAAVTRLAPHLQHLNEAVVIQAGLPSYAHMATVVKVGKDIVVKYGTYVSQTEYRTLKFIGQTTSVPVPEVLGTHLGDDGKTYIAMKFVEGQCLFYVWDTLTSLQKKRIADQLKVHFQQLHAIQGQFIGSVGRGPCKEVHFDEALNRGPFATEDCMNAAIVEAVRAKANYSASFVSATLSSLPRNHDIVFCHGNLNISHIIVDSKCEGIRAIVGWQRSGFFPEYWDFVNALTLTMTPFRSDWVLYVEKFLKPYYNEYPLWCQLRMTARWGRQLEGR